MDYQNWDMSVDDIYHKLINKQLEIHNHKDEVNHSGITAYEDNGKASTFYVGSKKTGTRLFLRVYDKKKEQIEQKGFRFQEAVNTDSWVRFEAVFKADYAHQLTHIIMKTDEEKLADLIVDKVVEKYRFYDSESKDNTDFTKALIEKSKGDFLCLRMESPRDNDFTRSFIHLVNGSGLFPAMYKCDETWGKKSSVALLKCLYDIYVYDYIPNEDVQLWLKKYRSLLARQSLEEELELLKLSNTRKFQTDSSYLKTAKAEHRKNPAITGDLIWGNYSL